MCLLDSLSSWGRNPRWLLSGGLMPGGTDVGMTLEVASFAARTVFPGLHSTASLTVTRVIPLHLAFCFPKNRFWLEHLHITWPECLLHTPNSGSRTTREVQSQVAASPGIGLGPAAHQGNTLPLCAIIRGCSGRWRWPQQSQAAYQDTRTLQRKKKNLVALNQPLT